MCLDGFEMLLFLKALVHLSSCVQTCIVFSLYLFYLHIFIPFLGSAEILAADLIKVSRLIIGFRKFSSFCHAKDDSLVCIMLISYSFQGDLMEKHQCAMSKTGKICLHTEVSYRLLTSAHPYAKI